MVRRLPVATFCGRGAANHNPAPKNKTSVAATIHREPCATLKSRIVKCASLPIDFTTAANDTPRIVAYAKFLNLH